MMETYMSFEFDFQNFQKFTSFPENLLADISYYLEINSVLSVKAMKSGLKSSIKYFIVTLD